MYETEVSYNGYDATAYFGYDHAHSEVTDCVVAYTEIDDDNEHERMIDAGEMESTDRIRIFGFCHDEIDRAADRI